MSEQEKKSLKVLVACEFSGTVRRAFRALGHDAWSCDLLPAEDNSEHHFNEDVINVLNRGWDLMIAHPPCTYLTNAGVCWLHKDPTRWDKMRDGAAFFKTLYDANIPRICVENPVMHKYAKDIIQVTQSQTIQPWMFGHPESKATCLWLRGLPLLTQTKNVKEEMLKLPPRLQQRLFHLPRSKDRWKERSRTFAGIAAAMAAQWG